MLKGIRMLEKLFHEMGIWQISAPSLQTFILEQTALLVAKYETKPFRYFEMQDPCIL